MPDRQPGGVAQSPATPPAFVVAVDEGGTLLPVARYAAGRWLNTWPAPEEDSKPVPSLADVPRAWLGRAVPTAWTLWPTGGGTTRGQITGTERSGGCVVSPKLTLPERRFPPDGAFDQVHPGLATTEGGVVRALEMMAGRSMQTTLPAAGAILTRIQPVVAALIATHEGQALADARTFGSPGATLTAPPRVEATVITLAEGVVFILPARHQRLPGRPTIGASFRVGNLATVRRVLAAGGVSPRTGPGAAERVVVEPSKAHGLWLELVDRAFSF